jgi:FAD:protein FMN transferase
MSGPLLLSGMDEIGRRQFSAWGSTVVVATTSPDAIEAAVMILHEELVAIDEACSRFRPDSELSRVHETGGSPVEVSGLLGEAIETALRVAEDTDGTVDPTVGSAVIELGYDRDFAKVPAASRAGAIGGRPRPAPGWRCVEWDRARRRVTVPAGVILDLGATAKALAADRASSLIAAATGSGVLVNLGGDVSLAGPPPDGGWAIGIAVACTTAPEESDVVVAIREGGLASSGTAVRTWVRGDRRVHHIVDPATGANAESRWRLVSVAAPSCVEANTVSTAAIVWGPSAIDRLTGTGLPCRLVGDDGTVVVLGGWPADPPENDGQAG